MQIVGIGTNVVECVRIGRLIEAYGERFLHRVFTPREMSPCRASRAPTESFAGQWAAKEAVVKCLGIQPSRALTWTDVELRRDAAGGWKVHVGGIAKDRAQSVQVADILVTIAHCRAYATAYALALRKG
jgi:holo-[acyl-carrier protein] synthase